MELGISCYSPFPLVSSFPVDLSDPPPTDTPPPGGGVIWWTGVGDHGNGARAVGVVYHTAYGLTSQKLTSFLRLVARGGG